MKISGFILVILLSYLIPLQAQNAIELGEVNWLRDIRQAVNSSKQSGKPILILFQEVPGCATCQRYGSEVLSHPLLVEGIEQEFVPLAIHNNKAGEDARVLKLFGEPAWNNPVVRIVDADMKDLVPRLDANYSAAGIADKMIKALNIRKKNIPGYLRLTYEYALAKTSKQMSFSMSCFWEGEKNLGNLEGVLSTEPGFIQGKEVVRVNYNPTVISTGQLIGVARKLDCAKSLFAEEKDLAEGLTVDTELKKSTGFKPDHEPQYYLRHTAYRYVPMLPIQASRLNNLLAKGGSPQSVLSPGQIEFFKFYQAHPSRGEAEAYHQQDFNRAWKQSMGRMKKA
ncbi:MAG: VPGUxxT family thioredoxin-like (seleno)protein, type 2 [Saprospiraceae bacterium]|nr:VPGUxxT family thioredoxin-like (seleno)protein, type 2 [Saprospiraceae bacterium]